MENWRKSIRKMHSPSNLENKVEEAEKIIDRFKTKHPELMALNPEIGIGNIIEDEKGKPCDYWILTVYHPFIFDIRLIPQKFEDIKVGASTMGGYPKEFPSQNAELPLEDWYSPKRFQKFVENNIELIRKNFRLPEMTIVEALDSITGGFEKHKKWAKRMKEERIEKHKEHIEFFNKLLEKTEVAFRQSDVYNENKSENWGYSVTATRFDKNKPVIVGFNWGSGNNWKNENPIETIQKEYPLSSFSGLYDELGSFVKVVNLFTDYLPEANNGIQTNFCFFRSQHEHKISLKDKKLSAPLFEELMEYLEPSALITFSRTLNDYFEQNGKLIDKQILEIQSKSKMIYASKGSVLIKDRKIDYYNLPHPNYPITTEARLQAWDYCFDNE